MAGPSYLSVGKVVDPYEGAQKALSQVGDIYSQFYDNTKKAEEANKLRLEREEIQRARDNQLARKEHMQNFDPGLGIGGAGIDKDLYARSQEERKVLEADNLAAYNAGNKDAFEPAEYARRLDEAQKGLITRKASEEVVREKLLRSGLYSPEEIDALTPLYVKGTTDVSAEVAASQASADAAWKQYMDTKGIPLEIQKLYLDNDANLAKIFGSQVSRLNAEDRAGGGSGSSGSGGSQKGKPRDLTMEEQTKFSEWGERRLGSKIWNRDGRNAEKLVFGSPIRINEALAEAGWPRETFVTTGETAQFAVNNVDSGFWDRSLRAEVDSPHGFEAEFSTWAGLPPRKADGSFITPQEYQAQDNDPSNIIRSRGGSGGGGYGSERMPPPVLTGVRSDLIAAIQSIPNYKTKSREDVHKEMIDKAYKNLRLNIAKPTTKVEKDNLKENINAAANNTGNRIKNLGNTATQEAINREVTKGSGSDGSGTPPPSVPDPTTADGESQQTPTRDTLLPYSQPQTAVEADVNNAVTRMSEIQRGLADPNLSRSEKKKLYQEAEIVRDSIRQLPDSDRILESIRGNARQAQEQSSEEQAQARKEQSTRESTIKEVLDLRERLAGDLSPSLRNINEDRLKQLEQGFPALEDSSIIGKQEFDDYISKLRTQIRHRSAPGRVWGSSKTLSKLRQELNEAERLAGYQKPSTWGAAYGRDVFPRRTGTNESSKMIPSNDPRIREYLDKKYNPTGDYIIDSSNR